MRKFIIILTTIWSCTSLSLSAQQQYRSFSTFDGDYIAYMKYNFEQNKQRYIGQKLDKLMEDYELEYGFVITRPENGTTVNGIVISPLTEGRAYSENKRGNFTGWLRITFRNPMVFDISPRIGRVSKWGDTYAETNYWLVAMKMKDGIIGNIEVVTDDPTPVPPSGFEEKMVDIYKQALSSNERRNARGGLLIVNILIDSNTGKVTGTDIEFNDTYNEETKGFKSVRPEKWASLDYLIKNAGLVFQIPKSVKNASYRWTYAESGDVPMKRYAAIKGTPVATSIPRDGFSVNTQKPASTIYYKTAPYREYTIRSADNGFEIKFIYCTYDVTELAKVRHVMAQDTEIIYSTQYDDQTSRTPMWSTAEFYDINEFLHSMTYEQALEMVEYFKNKNFFIIDEKPNMPNIGNKYPYYFGIREFKVNRIQ